MICKGCGATYERKAFNCPYCGKENEKMTAKRQQNELNRIYSQAQNIVTKPEKDANRFTKKAITIIVVVALIVFIVAMAVIILSRPLSMNKYERQQKNVAKLEEFCDKKDYKGMMEFLDEIDDIYSSNYDKYSMMQDIIEDVEYCQKDAAQLDISNTAETVNKRLCYDIYFLYVALDSIERFEDKAFAGDETEFIKEYRQCVYDLFNDTYKITDEEIEKWSRVDGKEPEAYSELADISYGRMTDK